MVFDTKRMFSHALNGSEHHGCLTQGAQIEWLPFRLDPRQYKRPQI